MNKISIQRCFSSVFFLLVTIFSISISSNAYSHKGRWYAPFLNDQSYDYRWGGSIYYGKMTDEILNRVLRARYGFARAELYSGEIEYQLGPHNLIRVMFRPLINTLNLAANVTYQKDPNGNVYEFNPFLLARWQHFPWDKYLKTTLGLGEGVSMASKRLAREQRDTKKAANDRKFLNFLMVEVAVSLPDHPEWQLVYRIHHRSGVFGLYSPGIVGSTAVQLGIRYRFN